MPETDATREAIELLVEYSRTTSWVVTIQLIAAILMIFVEACLLWAILKLSHYIYDLIQKMRYLTVKVEVMLDRMGWNKTSKFMKNVADGDDVEAARLKALADAEQAADLEPWEKTELDVERDRTEGPQ